MNRIILASGSPRRKEILTQAGIAFEVLVAEHEEHSDYKEPEDFVKDLARQKAEAAEKIIEKELSVWATGNCLEEQKPVEAVIIIGADTIVAGNHQILGKPKDEEEAFAVLSSLQGRTHEVFTGISVIIRDDSRKEICFAESTKVQVCSMEPEEIRSYIATGEPMDKAGSYAIQGKFARYIESIHGDYYNVVGFPISRFCREMKKNGFSMLFEKYL